MTLLKKYKGWNRIELGELGTQRLLFDITVILWLKGFSAFCFQIKEKLFSILHTTLFSFFTETDLLKIELAADLK